MGREVCRASLPLRAPTPVPKGPKVYFRLWATICRACHLHPSCRRTVHAAWEVLWGSTCVWCTSLLSIFHWQKLSHTRLPVRLRMSTVLCLPAILILCKEKMDDGFGGQPLASTQMILGSMDKGRLKSLYLPNFLR